MTLQINKLRANDASLLNWVGELGDLSVSRTDLLPRISDGINPGGIALATAEQAETIVGEALETALSAVPILLAQSGVAKAGIAAAATFVTLSIADNAGNTQIASAGVHGLTTSPAVGAWVGVTWAGGTGVDGIYKILSVDSTLAITIDLAYDAGLGTPTVAKATALIPLASIAIPAGALGANGVIRMETALTAASAGSTKSFEIRWSGTYIDDNAVPSGGSLTQRWAVHNRGNEAINIYTYKDAFVSGNFAVDTSADTVLTLNAVCDAANERCTLEAYSAILQAAA